MKCSQRLVRVLEVALPVRDILEQRVDTACAPEWCEARGWSSFLLSLDDDALRSAEAYGLAACLPDLAGAPRDLRELAREIMAATQLPMLARSMSLDQAALRSVGLRKRGQLSALLAAVAPMASEATRIVDVGAGSGHFTRLSAGLFQRDAVGLEQDQDRVRAARARVSFGDGRATFLAVDARNHLAFAERDLAIGLHACGELGDRVVEAAAHARCDLALVSCCLQKISTSVRAPLSHLTREVRLRREHLGLTNLTAQPQGVEASIEVTLRARQTRYALGQLLRERGVSLAPGAEMAGINRRRANLGLAAVAEQALRLRDLPPATSAELDRHDALAADHYWLIRRFSLPRSMLARLIEVLVSLDRAAHLEERGLQVEVATLFERALSPRNIGVFASCSGRRLPAAQAASP